MKWIVAQPHKIIIGKQQQIALTANGDIAQCYPGIVLALGGGAAVKRVVRRKGQSIEFFWPYY